MYACDKFKREEKKKNNRKVGNNLKNIYIYIKKLWIGLIDYHLKTNKQKKKANY